MNGYWLPDKIRIARAERLDDPALPFVIVADVFVGSLVDGMEIAQRINRDNQDRELRVPTKEELRQIVEKMGDKIEEFGQTFWTTTEADPEEEGRKVFYYALWDREYRAAFPSGHNAYKSCIFIEDRPSTGSALP